VCCRSANNNRLVGTIIDRDIAIKGVARGERLVGIISLGDIAVMKGGEANGAALALSGISRPGGQHSQTG